VLAGAAVLLLAGLPPAWQAGVVGAEARRPDAAVERIAIVGVDAADWRAIDLLVSRGELPTFSRLRRVAACGTLRADLPLLSPIIWTTIATGRNPEDHGVLDFMVDLPGGGQAPVGGGARRVKAMWEIWSDAGRRSLVAGWWATWPADDVNGIVVSDRMLSSQLTGAARPNVGLVHPAAEYGRIAGLLVSPASVAAGELRRMLPGVAIPAAPAASAARLSAAELYRDRAAHFRAAVADTRSIRRVVAALARGVQPDLTASYYEIVDTASHLFVRDRSAGASAIAAAYEEVDRALSDTAAALAPDTLLIVLSDHGFQAADAGVAEDPADLSGGATAWHRPYGIIAVTTAGALAGVRQAPSIGPIGTVSPLDILPTILARAGLPLASDMPGRVIPALAPAVTLARVPSYGTHRLPPVKPASSPGEGAAELERLRALGYVTGTQATTSLARVNLGEILVRRGDTRAAITELEPLVRQNPLDERAVSWLARGYIAAGRRDDALALYDRVIRAGRMTGRKIDPLFVLSATDLDIEAGRVSSARERLAKVPETLRGSPEVLVAGGAVSDASGRIDAAERAYRSVLSATPANREALTRLVDLLLRRARDDDAVTVTARLAGLFPASPEHQSLLGEAALAARQYQRAERAFAAALELAPASEAVRLDLARARLLDGRPAAALDCLAGAPVSAEREALRGAGLSAARQWGPAIDAFERSASLAAPTADLLAALGRAQLEAGRRADAVRTLERSLQLSPNQPSVRTLLEAARR
jgi:tetratricopeptide (TPR) repeat protein